MLYKYSITNSGVCASIPPSSFNGNATNALRDLENPLKPVTTKRVRLTYRHLMTILEVQKRISNINKYPRVKFPTPLS